jgi:hypothetical protein
MRPPRKAAVAREGHGHRYVGVAGRDYRERHDSGNVEDADVDLATVNIHGAATEHGVEDEQEEKGESKGEEGRRGIAPERA